VPFLLHRNPRARLAAVTVSYYRLAERDRLASLRAFGEALGSVLREAGDPVLCVASSDMSHVGESFSHLPPPGQTANDYAHSQDRLALDAYLALDPGRFFRAIHEHGITMCGWAPALVALCAALARGARKAELVRYATSAETSGDVDHVVGYAGVLIS
jgi:AmmeMemoRadiSam system protein B